MFLLFKDQFSLGLKADDQTRSLQVHNRYTKVPEFEYKFNKCENPINLTWGQLSTLSVKALTTWFEFQHKFKVDLLSWTFEKACLEKMH